MENLLNVNNITDIIVVFNVLTKELEYYVNNKNELIEIDKEKFTPNFRRDKNIKSLLKLEDNKLCDDFKLVQEYHLDSKRKRYHIIVGSNDILTTRSIYESLYNNIHLQEFEVRLKSKIFDSKAIVEEMTRIYLIDDKLQKSYFSFENFKYEITNKMFDHYEPFINNKSFVKLNKDIIDVSNDIFLVYKSSDEKEKKQVKKLTDNNVISYYNYSDSDKELYIKDTIVDESIVDVNDKIIKEAILEILKEGLDSLSSDEFQIIKGLFVGNLKQTDLANKLGISQQTLNYRKKKILKKINSKFSSKGINNLV